MNRAVPAHKTPRVDSKRVVGLWKALARQNVELQGLPLVALASAIERAVRHERSSRERGLFPRHDTCDILHWIAVERDHGQRDEALWRCFLAAHFGRGSANSRDRAAVESAARFLRAFTDTPVWTFSAVRDTEALAGWLESAEDRLRSLKFGNHRKYESKRPQQLLSVITSFLRLVDDRGGSPSLLFDDSRSKHERERFACLFRRLKPLNRFARTGRFDLLILLADLHLVAAEPGSCFLAGSTGPLRGARRLWCGVRDVEELESKARELEASLRITPRCLEDALCNWQKADTARAVCTVDDGACDEPAGSEAAANSSAADAVRRRRPRGALHASSSRPRLTSGAVLRPMPKVEALIRRR